MGIWDNINAIAKELLGDTQPQKVNLSEISKEINRPNDISENLGNKKVRKHTDVSDIEVLPEYQFILKAIENKCDLPFGGIPVVFVGDILQLPPVVADREVGIYYSHRYDSQYFYSAEIFKKVNIFPLELTKVFRQSDLLFIDALDKIRTMSRIERWDVRTLRKKIGGMLYQRTTLSKNTRKVISAEIGNLRDGRMTPDAVFCEYLTELPPMGLLQNRLHLAIEHARGQVMR